MFQVESRGPWNLEPGTGNSLGGKMSKADILKSTLAFLDRDLSAADPDVAHWIREEENRQNGNLELIASENWVSRAVREAQGSVLTNKYAEGYPGRRYYGGCEFIDKVEALAIERSKALFSAEHANVQPHSGSQANMAAYMTVAKPGETILGMNLSHGGHLTHGHPLSFSGKDYKVVAYGVSHEDERVDFEELARLAREHRPKIIIAGASAYVRELDFRRFAEVAEEVGAALVVDIAHIAGLVIAGLHMSPIPYAPIVTSTTHKAVALAEAATPEFADYQRRIVENAKALAEGMTRRGLRLVSGGTDNHMMLLDVGARGISGKDAEKALDRVQITVNKNTIPFDTRPPLVASGIRIGTPAVTTRGMGISEMETIADCIFRVLDAMGDTAVEESVRRTVGELCAGFPLVA